MTWWKRAWAEANMVQKVGLVLSVASVAALFVGVAVCWGLRLESADVHPAWVAGVMAVYGVGGLLALGFDE